MSKKNKYALKVKGELFKIKDMMDECPFEGSEMAYLAGIYDDVDDEGNDVIAIDIMSDGEGYTYTSKDIKEMKLGKTVQIVKLEKGYKVVKL